MTPKPDPIDADSLDDYVTLLADAQYYDNRDRRWLLPAAVLLLGLALGPDGWTAKLAACATLATLGYWLRAEMQWAGRYWFLHLVLKHDLIRPREDIATAVLTAMLEIDDAVQAAQTPRCSEVAAGELSAEGDSPEARHSASSGSQEGHS